MYCKYVKLTNGDDLLVSTDDDCLSFGDKEFLNVKDPVQISSIKIPEGMAIIETYILHPWIKIAKTDSVQIPIKNIVVAVDVQESAVEQYKEFVFDYNTKKHDIVEDKTEEENDGDESPAVKRFLEALQEETDSDSNDNSRRPRTRFKKNIH